MPPYSEKGSHISNTIEQARREGAGGGGGEGREGTGGEVFPGPETFGGPRCRSKILKMVFQVASFWPKICIKSIFDRCSAPDPAGGTYVAPPNP